MHDAATPIAVEQLGQVFGPSIGYHIARCRHGGYLVIVNGAAHSAHTTLHEAIGAMGQFAANEYGEGAVPPERATDVTPPLADHQDERMPRIIRPPHMQPRPVPAGEPADQPNVAERARATAVLVLGLLAVGTRGLVGV